MPHSATRTAPVLALLVLTLACGSEAKPPAVEQPSVTVAPVPTPDPGQLLTIMIDLGRDMNAISDALWRDDLATVATAARAIAEHPHVSASERERIQSVLGDNFPDFVKGDQRVHQSAVRLAEAAAASDMGAALEELAELQSGCVACHDGFRDVLK